MFEPVNGLVMFNKLSVSCEFNTITSVSTNTPSLVINYTYSVVIDELIAIAPSWHATGENVHEYGLPPGQKSPYLHRTHASKVRVSP